MSPLTDYQPDALCLGCAVDHAESPSELAYQVEDLPLVSCPRCLSHGSAWSDKGNHCQFCLGDGEVWEDTPKGAYWNIGGYLLYY